MPLPDIMPHHFEVLQKVWLAGLYLVVAKDSLDKPWLCRDHINQALDTIMQIPDRMGYKETYTFIHVLFMLRVTYSDAKLSFMLGTNPRTLEQWAEGREVPTDEQLIRIAELYLPLAEGEEDSEGP